ncbi:MAG TPA: PAS domain S-box protein, partial [Burkholderiales bacterium]|nr:PAS domain S-box protein [Burkholderiales bacterium]
EVENALDSVRDLLRALSRAGAVRDLDPGRCSAYLEEVNRGLTQYRDLGVIGRDGALVCSALPFSGRVDASGRRYFRDALERKAFAVGEYQHSGIAGFPSLNVGYPVLAADGSVAAVVFAALDLSGFDESLAAIASPMGGAAMLMDRNGTVLSPQPDSGSGVGRGDPAAPLLAAAREPGARPRVLPGLDGVIRMYAFARLQNEQSGLVVAVGIPVATILAPIQAQLANTVARMLVALVIALIGAWVLGWFGVVKPAAAVVKAARRLADGDFSVRSGAAGHTGELGAIGRAFDEMAESLARSETRYRATFEQAALGIAHLSPEGRFLRANRSLCEMFGYAAGELLELDLQHVTHAEDLENSYALMRRVASGEGGEQAIEKRYLRKDGTVVWGRVTLSVARTAAGEPDYFIAVVDDISDKKWAERRIERLAAMYRTLSATNEAIVRVAELPALYQEVCDIVAKFGGFVLAWVGTVDRRGRVLEVSGRAGEGVGYVEHMELPLNTQVAEGCGPSASAVVSGKHVVCNDFLNDPATAPWHQRARQFGIAASGAFPLRQGGQVVGALSVYSSEAGFFDSEIVELLVEMSANISFALDAMARDAERRAAEEVLRRNDERLDAMLRLSEGAGSLSIQEITRRALDAGVRLSESRAGAVFLVRPDRDSLKVMASIGTGAAEADSGPHLALGQAGPWVECIRLGRPVIQNQPDARHGLAAPGRAPVKMRYAAIPASDQGRVTSVLLVAGRETEYREDDLRQLQLVGETLWRLTEGKRAQFKALDAEGRFRGTFEHSAVGMANVGLDGRFMRVNRRLCEMAGYSEEEMLARRFQDITHPEDLPKDLELANRVIAGEISSYNLEKRYMRRDGRVIWGLLTVSAMRRPDGRMDYFIAVVEDITQLKEAQERLRLDAMVFEGSREGITITDAQPRILACNRAFTQITGYEEHEVLGKNPAVLRSGRQDREFYRAMWESLNTTGRWSGEIWNRKKSGEVYPEWLAISALEGPDGRVSHYIGIFSDISPQKQAEETIQRLLQYDHVTQLPNRALLRERLDLTLAHVRHRRRKAAVLLLNLGRFRSINETLGHPAGDTVLKEVAGRLSGTLRSGDTVSRLDADNFAVILNDMERSDDAGILASKLLDAVGRPVAIADQELKLTAWIGISVHPEDGDDGETLMRGAQAALDSARTDPRGGYRFSDPALNEAALERRLLGGELRGAVARGELLLHYQPLVDLVSGELNGVEALLRWNHPRLGVVLPHRFIHIAEETGVISAIGEWALEVICRQGQRWREEYEPNLRMSVNVSSLQIRDGTLPAAVRRALELSGLPPEALEIEVTESYFLTPGDGNRKTLEALKDIGVTFAIDDFGTHYAGLSFIRYFPVDRVKVDQSFIREIATHAGDAAISRAIIAMAHGLGMKVSAEGVETEAQLQFLRKLHCDEAQGFYFSPAVPVDDLEKHFKIPSRLLTMEAAPRTLLLVDDEANVLASLKRALRREGYQILAASSAREGMEMLATHNVSVILSDQRMPDMTGTEFLSRVKVMYPRVVRIIVSGHTDFATITDAINRGAVYKFLTKPWEDGVLRDTLREAFERYETAQAEGARAT